ncbi:hypothetical protein [Francisella tularensis]|uniref:hypothetical protein n=1 Tax=Francisella tularensis TaxID=263 RepID=UPI002381AFC5|nr:hypothetical protein [Francisella tularensis]MDE4971818.1 hypothetical protein [Francisella tularensis subsp. holarctica]
MHKQVGSRIQIRRHREDNFSTEKTFSSSFDSAIAMFNHKIKSQSNSSQAILSLSTKLLCL